MRFSILFLFVVLAMTLDARGADACPAGRPCTKYRRRAPVEAIVGTYVRNIRARPPIQRRRVERFLVDSLWSPATEVPVAQPYETLPARALRFLFARTAEDAPPSSARSVLIRQIERRRGVTYVEVDGAFYTLGRCIDRARRATSCLNLADGLPDEDARQFATPPPRSPS